MSDAVNAGPEITPETGTEARPGLMDRLRGMLKRKPAAPAAAEATAAEAPGGKVGWREVLGSPVLFRSVVIALVILALAQWAMIFFNYWR